MTWELNALNEIKATESDENVGFWRRRKLRQQDLYQRETVGGVGYIGSIARLTGKGEKRLAELEAASGSASIGFVLP